MNFNKHYDLEGKHAFLGASNNHWLNYSHDKLRSVYLNQQAKALGTRLHDFAREAIELKQKLKGGTQTLAMYVNDAIGYQMQPEQVLYYSSNCFGTADAISFKKNLLRIHDLKTGKEKASMVQLKVYAALFCLEYKQSPEDIKMELRIYQNDNVEMLIPEPDEIKTIMEKIVEFDMLLEKITNKEFGR